MSIEINCTGSDTIQLHELTEFQGELKERSAGDVEKIIKSIKKHGFSFPFFVWKNDGKNNVIDGHGRLKALQQMAAAAASVKPCSTFSVAPARLWLPQRKTTARHYWLNSSRNGVMLSANAGLSGRRKTGAKSARAGSNNCNIWETVGGDNGT